MTREAGDPPCRPDLVLPPEAARDPIPGPAKRIKEEWRNDSVGGVPEDVPFNLPTGGKLRWKFLASHLK